MSTSATHRRISILEKEGMIEKYTASLSGEKLGYSMIFFVEVSLENQSDKTLASFEKAALERPEVLECYTMTGIWDYVLKIVTRDIRHYEDFVRNTLNTMEMIRELHSHMAVTEIKNTTALPINTQLKESSGN